jgi:predicted aspartyl protease
MTGTTDRGILAMKTYLAVACIAGVAAALIVPAAGLADDKSDDKSPESVLASKGLVRQGKVYLLPRVEQELASLGVENMKLEMSKMRTALEIRAMERTGSPFDGSPGSGPGGPPPMNPGYPPPDMEPPPPPPPTFLGRGGIGVIDPRQRQAANELAQQKLNAMIERKAGLERLEQGERRAANHAQFVRLIGQYDQIAADPQVKAALRQLNKGRDPKFAVGPAPMYESRIITATLDALGEKGLRINKGHSNFSPLNTFSTVNDEDLAKAVSDAREARTRFQGLEKAAARSEAKLADLIHRKPRETSSGAEPTAQIKAAADEPLHQLAEAAVARARFVKAVRDLPPHVEAALRRRSEVVADPDVKEALSDLDRHRLPRMKHRIVAGLRFDESVKSLAAFAASVESKTIRLEPDRDRLLVEAMLNDGARRKMVVDPKVTLVRLSARAAAEVKVKLEDTLPIDVATDDSRTFRARRTTLKSLRVGDFTAHDVVCVVMPESFGDAPSILGASFLDHFVADLDSSAGTLTLTHVNTQAPAKVTSTPGGPGS